MSGQVDFEVIVVGAGIMGSTSAYYSAKELGNGSKVLLLEQFDFLHRKGSSHGDSRITRYTYEQEHYAELMFDSFKLWAEAEKAAGYKVFTQTGGLDFGKKDNRSLLGIIANAKKFKIEHEVFQAESELQKKFPMLKLPPDWMAMYSPSAGILNATKSVSMFQQLCRSAGCHLIDNCPVTSIESGGNGVVIVRTKTGKTYRARKCIITAGTWNKKMMKTVANVELPIIPTQTTIAYWKVDRPELYHSSKFPVFLSYEDPLLYGTPCHEFPNLLKCAAHYGPSCDPDNRTFDPGFDQIHNGVSPWLQTIFTGISKTPQVTESCMYSETADMDYILDKVPGFPEGNVLLGAGFSGHGFKLGPVVGRLLAKWVISEKFPYNERMQKVFSMNRFTKSSL